MDKRFMVLLQTSFLREENHTDEALNLSLRVSFQLVHPSLDDQGNAFMGCDCHIEIAIKRWKRVLDVEALRAKAHRPLAEVWPQGKVVSALMRERRMRRMLDDRWGRLDQERVGTWWRLWGMLEDMLAPLITGALFRQEEAGAACLRVVTERPRRRKLQQLPPEAVALLYRRAESKHEELPLAA